ncbi:MAG: signal recognition particle-docking protein FtsY [Enterobacterales bacterium]
MKQNQSFLFQLKKKLLKTKQHLGDKLNLLFNSKKNDISIFDSIEQQLIISDVGINTTKKIINTLIRKTNNNYTQDFNLLKIQLKEELNIILNNIDNKLIINKKYCPFIILVVGVNGVGKTTTSGKLANKLKMSGNNVMLVAGDTFRASAIEQLKQWGQYSNIPVISQHMGSDASAVVFDALKSAKSKNIDVLIIDTAGRMHVKSNLMLELKKIIKTIKKIDIHAPHEIMLIIDACNGQNSIIQTKIFHNSINLTGLTITKLDGTSKGGIIFSLADQFNIPIRFIGIGKSINDLCVFKKTEFISSIFYS